MNNCIYTIRLRKSAVSGGFVLPCRSAPIDCVKPRGCFVSGLL